MKYYLGCAWNLLLLQLGLGSVRELKQQRVKVFLGSLSRERVNALSIDFAKKDIPLILRPNALERLKEHQQKGHEVYIVSASFAFCLEVWAKQNGVHLVTNNVDWSAKKLVGPDCNGEEKVNRLRKIVDLEKVEEIFAYGDTPGDHPMLEIADNPYYCFFHHTK